MSVWDNGKAYPALNFEDCADCGEPIPDEDAVWIGPSGVAAGPPVGEPYHVECAPPEPDWVVR